MKNKDCPEFENSVFCMLGTSSVRYLVGKLYSMLKMPQKFIFEGQNNKKMGLTKEQLSNLWVTRATYQLGWALYLYIKVYFDMSNSY